MVCTTINHTVVQFKKSCPTSAKKGGQEVRDS